MDWSLNYLAVLVSAVAIFMLGGLWYSPVMFAKKWVALQGKSMEEMSGGASPALYVQVFICGLVTSFVMGSQAHCPHPWEMHHNAYVHYGPGNLFFDQFWHPVRDAAQDNDAER